MKPKTKNFDIGAELYYQMTEAFHGLRKLDTDFPSSIPVNVYKETVTRYKQILVSRSNIKQS